MLWIVLNAHASAAGPAPAWEGLWCPKVYQDFCSKPRSRPKPGWCKPQIMQIDTKKLCPYRLLWSHMISLLQKAQNNAVLPERFFKVTLGSFDAGALAVLPNKKSEFGDYSTRILECQSWTTPSINYKTCCSEILQMKEGFDFAHLNIWTHSPWLIQVAGHAACRNTSTILWLAGLLIGRLGSV